MRYFKKLEGDRVYLSPMNIDDYELYTKWISDLSTSIPLGNASSNYSIVREKEVLERLAKEDHSFAIVSKDTDELLGNCSLFAVNQIHRTAEVGLFIGEPENRGKGYGKEALELILAYGFKVINLNNIMLRVFSFNERGIKAYKKVGFREFGRRKEAYYFNNKYYDEIYMEFLQNEYKEKWLDDILD